MSCSFQTGGSRHESQHHPFVVEGEGDAALKIYFENEDNKQAYLDISIEETGGDFESKLDNPN